MNRAILAAVILELMPWSLACKHGMTFPEAVHGLRLDLTATFGVGRWLIPMPA